MGGIAGLLMVVGLLWFLKSRGFLRRDGDEHFTEDMWKPPAHSPGVVVGARADDEDGDGAANHSGDSGGMMSEKDGAVMVGGQGNRQSWYGVSVDGAAGAYRSTSPEVEGYGPQAGYRDSRQPEYDARSYGDRLSYRQSMQSHSSHSHDGFGSQHSPSSFSHIPLPDHRLSQQQYYQHMSQVAQQPGSFGFALYDGRREELAAEGSDSADHSESGRTAATTGSSNGFASSHSQRGAPRPDLPVETRPTLPVIEGSYNSSSSSSAPSSSIPSSDTPSSDVPSAEASNTFLPQDSLAESERIKSFKSRLRPGMMARSESADSFKVPSQFLGARIANATPTEEKAEFTFEQSGRVSLSLPFFNGELTIHAGCRICRARCRVMDYSGGSPSARVRCRPSLWVVFDLPLVIRIGLTSLLILHNNRELSLLTIYPSYTPAASLLRAQNGSSKSAKKPSRQLDEVGESERKNSLEEHDVAPDVASWERRRHRIPHQVLLPEHQAPPLVDPNLARQAVPDPDSRSVPNPLLLAYPTLDEVEEGRVRRFALAGWRLATPTCARAPLLEEGRGGEVRSSSTVPVQVGDDLATEVVERGDAGEGGVAKLGRVVEASPEEGSAGEGTLEVREAVRESVRVPLKSLGRELAEGVGAVLLVESGEVAEVPEARRELDEVGLGAVEGGEKRNGDVREAVRHGDCVQRWVRIGTETARGERRTWRVEMLAPEERLPLEFDAVRESVVKDRHYHEVVLLDVTDRGPTVVKVGLVAGSNLLVDAVLESRRRERVVQCDRGKDAAGEIAEVAVVLAFDVVAKEEDGAALKPV